VLHGYAIAETLMLPTINAVPLIVNTPFGLPPQRIIPFFPVTISGVMWLAAFCPITDPWSLDLLEAGAVLITKNTTEAQLL